jgi:hypothetical protein
MLAENLLTKWGSKFWVRLYSSVGSPIKAYLPAPYLSIAMHGTARYLCADPPAGKPGNRTSSLTICQPGAKHHCSANPPPTEGLDSTGLREQAIL